MTGADLRRIFDEQRVVRGSYRQPSSAAYEKLAERVTDLSNACLKWVLGDDPADERADKVAAALDTLEQLLPVTRARLTATLRSDGVTVLDRLAETVREARAFAWANPHERPRAIERWHDVAVELAEAFRSAMDSTNAGTTFALSNRGPLARFLASVIPKVTGEQPRCDAIARYLQRRARATSEG
jgi:hypothetical protein